MQLIIRVHLDEPLNLPINYNHILQAVIYNAIYDKRYASFIHDSGSVRGKARMSGSANEESCQQDEQMPCRTLRTYKLFQFGQLNGKYVVRNKRITFTDEMWFEVRSVNAELIRGLKRHIEENGINIQKTHFDDIRMELRDDTVECEQIIATMLSPVTVHATDQVTGKTIFFRPDEIEFKNLVEANFVRKYEAYTGIIPDEPIELLAVSYDESDKFVTRYKDSYITGWRGRYIISGQRKYLDFLYQVGLGSKNSQGFGMFDWESYVEWGEY